MVVHTNTHIRNLQNGVRLGFFFQCLINLPGRKDAAEVLLKHGASVFAQSYSGGVGVLHQAAKSGNNT